MLPEQDVPSLRLADAWSDQYDLGIATFLLDAGSRAAEAMMRALSPSRETITTHALVENESRAGVGYERFLTRVLESSELRATVRAVYAYFSPRDGDAFTLDVDVDDRDGNASTPRASLRAASNGIGPVLRVACEGKAPMYSSRSLAKVAVRAFDAPDDPIDRAAHDAAHDALATMSLWYGHLALMVRNFATAQSTIVSAVATTEEVWPPRSPRFEQTRRWMRALQRPGDDLRAYAVAMVEAG